MYGALRFCQLLHRRLGAVGFGSQCYSPSLVFWLVQRLRETPCYHPPMMINPRLSLLIICVVPICIIHAWLATLTFGLAFGFGETGEHTLSLLMGIASIALAPLLVFADPLSALFGDNTVITVCAYSSAILWWIAIVWLLKRLQKRLQRKSDE